MVLFVVFLLLLRYAIIINSIELMKIKMMKISKKCEYALGAILELAMRQGHSPLKTPEIAKAQGVSTRFLEVILNELKHGGFVESKRGNEGGYLLSKSAHKLTVGDIIQYIEGPFIGIGVRRNRRSPFDSLWKELAGAIDSVCSNKTFAEIAEAERAKQNSSALTYVI